MAFQDIRKSRKWLSAEEIRILLLFLIVLAGLLALNLYLARMLPAGEWLFLRWNGARAFLVEHSEPYSTLIAERVQQIVYERQAFATEYRYVLSDPFYILLLYTPLVLFPDVVNWLFPSANVGFELARGIWMLIAEIALMASVLFSIRLSEWEPRSAMYLLLVVYGLLNFFSLNALITASPAILLMFLYLSILLALRSFSDELAGALLLLAAYQWDVSALFFLFIVVFVITNRRWHVLAGFGMTLVVLLIVSFLLNPGWGLPYIRAVLSTLFQNVNVNLNHIVSNWFPNQRISIAGAISLLVLVVVFAESLASTRAHFRRVVWTAALALSAMPLVGLAIFPANYVVLILPLVLVVAAVWERWAHQRFLRIGIVLILGFAVPFLLYLKTLDTYSPLYIDLLSVLPPVAAILGLYWMRWWVMRSPRTWADQIGLRK
jgi:hypothetical protein